MTSGPTHAAPPRPARLPDAAVEVRTAVRRFLDAAAAGGALDCGQIAVACSGGADSLALAAATVRGAGHRSDPLAVHGLVVDHGLQPGSADVAARTARRLTEMGCTSVRVLRVAVDGGRNVEAAARRARYDALRAARPHPSALVLLGHTMDDQAETVLLGLGRGSGARSIAGMRELDPPWGRPLLGVRRAATREACAADGIEVWDDPHNADPRFRRSRLRAEVLPLLEDVLAGGVTQALARTAAQLREDCDALDAIAADLLTAAAAGQNAGADGGLDVDLLTGAPPAVRRRSLRSWLLAGGATELTDAHLRAVDALVGRWRGQGAVDLPGRLVARRAHGRLHLVRRGAVRRGAVRRGADGVRRGADGEG